jgi:hypothetical protein
MSLYLVEITAFRSRVAELFDINRHNPVRPAATTETSQEATGSEEDGTPRA